MSTFARENHRAAMVALIATLLIVLIASPLIAYVNIAPVSGQVEGESGTPVFPSPAPWFDWGQRCISDLMVPGVPYPVGYTYLKGWGNYVPDIMVDGQPYKVNIVMSSPRVPPYPKAETYRAYLKSVGTPEELHWYMRGSWDPSTALPGTIFDGDILNFEYPLYLGKTWTDATTAPSAYFGTVSVTTSAEAVAYIEPVLDESGAVVTYNVVEADGHDYDLPDLNCDGNLGEEDVAAIPLPRRELGDISWEDMMATTDAEIGWRDVYVPAGPRQGENIQGYYVVEQNITTTATNASGYTFPVSKVKMEAWKDVRGCVPVQIVERGQMSGSGWTTQTTTTIARRWTGNFPWFQYEFGSAGAALAVRVDDTAIGEGGGTFQFTTRARDYGCKQAGDGMTVDLEEGLVTIDYEDDYITCQATLRQVPSGRWVGHASITDLATGRRYVVAGLAGRA